MSYHKNTHSKKKRSVFPHRQRSEFGSLVLAFVYDYLDHIRVSFFECSYDRVVLRYSTFTVCLAEEDKLNENHQKLTSAFFM